MNFEAYYNSYWSDRNDSYDPRRLALMVRYIEPGENVLELCCGPGILGKLLVEKGAKVTGTDFSQVALDRAKAKGLDTYKVDPDHEKLPFNDNSFDAVVSNSSLEHIFFPEKAVQEGMRVLKPGGKFIWMVPNIAHWRFRLWLLMGRFPYIENSPTDTLHIRLFTYRELKRLCKRNKLIIERVDGNAGLWVRELYPPVFHLPGIKHIYEFLTHIYPQFFARYLSLYCRKSS